MLCWRFQALYNIGSQPFTIYSKEKLAAAHHTSQRRTLGITQKDKVWNESPITDFRPCSQLYFLYDALCYYHCYCLCTCICVFLNLLFSHKSVTKLSVCHCKSNYYQHQHHRCHGYLRSFGTGDWCGLGWHIRGTLLAVADRKVLALDVSVVLTDYTASATKTLYIISIFQTQTTHWAFS